MSTVIKILRYTGEDKALLKHLAGTKADGTNTLVNIYDGNIKLEVKTISSDIEVPDEMKISGSEANFILGE